MAAGSKTRAASVQSTLGTIPCALDTLLSLAAEVKKGKAPAAELILLLDGGELKAENVAPVLAAFQRMRNAAKAGRRLPAEVRRPPLDRRHPGQLHPQHA